jgi:hypothetical protein
VPDSSIARLTDAAAPTLAGPEIGVASTKGFTCQLAVLAALAMGLGSARDGRRSRRIGVDRRSTAAQYLAFNRAGATCRTGERLALVERRPASGRVPRHLRERSKAGSSPRERDRMAADTTIKNGARFGPDQVRAAVAYRAAADCFDAEALGFWDRVARRHRFA